jgi:CDP-6-deoxy-D-xylo-4-hexulose-3-dehydrase
MTINHPLMFNNFQKGDFKNVIKLLKKKNPVLTQHKNVKKFENLWSKWLGVKYSVFVNSGSSANLVTISGLQIINKTKYKNEIIVPALTWSSDISSIIRNGFKPIFVDINLNNLGAAENQILSKISKKTCAIFLTHAQGFNALTKKILNICKKQKIYLIEDACESHGAEFNKKKIGTFGFASNFSFYYAHHMSTIEGGMICTNNYQFYELIRILRGHGMHREMESRFLRNKVAKKYNKLSPKFIFLHPGYNFRNNEIGALIGISQLKNLSNSIKLRNRNFYYFLKNLNKEKYFIDYDLEGISNYAFPIILKKRSLKNREKFERILSQNKIEFRRGNAGGGNQIRQPYVKNLRKKFQLKNFKNVEVVHHFGYYIGNFPSLQKTKILKICNLLNKIKFI